MSITTASSAIAQRRRRAGRVEPVALLDRAAHLVGLASMPAPPQLGRAAAGALGRIGRQKRLDRARPGATTVPMSRPSTT